jgi:hypothetical protein
VVPFSAIARDTLFSETSNVQTGSEDTLLFNVYLRLSLRGAFDITECRRTFTLLRAFILQNKTAAPSSVVRYKDRERDIS